MFILFLHLKIKNNKWINGIAACTLGVYLIHENIFMRPYLWHSIFHTRETLESSFFYLRCFGSVAAVYIICSIIDYLRIITFEKIYVRVLDRYVVPKWERLCSFFSRVID